MSLLMEALKKAQEKNTGKEKNKEFSSEQGSMSLEWLEIADINEETLLGTNDTQAEIPEISVEPQGKLEIELENTLIKPDKKKFNADELDELSLNIAEATESTDVPESLFEERLLSAAPDLEALYKHPNVKQVLRSELNTESNDDMKSAVLPLLMDETLVLSPKDIDSIDTVNQGLKDNAASKLNLSLNEKSNFADQQKQFSGVAKEKINVKPSVAPSPMEASQILAASSPLIKNRKRRTLKITLTVAVISLTLMSGYFYYQSLLLSQTFWPSTAVEEASNVDSADSVPEIHESAVPQANSRSDKTNIIPTPSQESALSSEAQVFEKPPKLSNINANAASVRTENREPLNTASAPKKIRTQDQKIVDPVLQQMKVERSVVDDPINVNLAAGYAAYNQGNYGEAERYYVRALESDKNNRDALLGMAAIAVVKMNYEKGKHLYNTLLKLNANDSLALAGLINLMSDINPVSAESELKFLIANGSDAPYMHFVLGNVHVLQKNWPNAQEAFFKAFSGDSSNPDYAYNLAVSLDQLGEYVSAKLYYEKALSLSAKHEAGFDNDQVLQRIASLERGISAR